jgi:hypothetical protein
LFFGEDRDRLQAVVQQRVYRTSKEISLLNLYAAVGREAMEFRLAIVVNSREELVRGLKDYSQSTEEVEDSVPILMFRLMKRTIRGEESSFRESRRLQCACFLKKISRK